MMTPVGGQEKAWQKAAQHTAESLRRSGKAFFCPRLTRRYLLRVVAVGACTAILATWVVTPCRIQGDSMAPTYRDGGMAVIWRGAFRLRRPRRGEVVAIRAAGPRVMFLKRVVGVEGDSVGFQSGRLLLNGEPLDEPYVAGNCDWSLAPRQVPPGWVYVVGDNRSMPMEHHVFGATEVSQLAGRPLW